MDNQTKLQQQLVRELGLDNLPQDKQEALLVKMTEVLLKRIFLETIEKLSDQARVDYEKMVEQGADAGKVEEFLKSNIDDYEGMVKQAIESFKEEMKNNN